MTRLDGIDGSHYQTDAGPVDLQQVRAIPTWWVSWKATQSTQGRDPSFSTIRQQWLDFQYRLPYHWLSSTTRPFDQADHFLNVTGGLVPGEGAQLDAEERGITADECVEWCEAVEAETQRSCSVYTGIYVSGGSIWRSQALRHGKYGPRPMHVAAYISEQQLSARMKTLGLLPNFPWDAWQFSSSGPVAGIVGRCDMNRIDNAKIYDSVCGILAPSRPTEDNMQIVDPPQRVYDSRSVAPLAAGETRTIHVADAGSACAINITVIGSAQAGYLVAFGGATPPPVSDVNFAAGQVIANHAIVPLTGGAINVWANVACNVIVDLQAVWP